MTRYFVTIPITTETDDANVKPKTDLAFFLADLGFETIGLKIYQWQDADSESVMPRIEGQFDGMGPGDILVYQFPIEMGYKYEERTIDEAHRRGTDVIGVIHDLDYLRSPRAHEQFIIECIQKMDVVITPSEQMKRELQAKGIRAPIIVRGPWDFRHFGLENQTVKYAQVINYAGYISAAKTGFFNQIDDDIDIRVFGGAQRGFHVNNQIIREGVKKAELLPQDLTQGYGLAWNGQNFAVPEDIIGSYMEYAWLYKCSLYLAAGMPVIVWSQGPMAEFVQAHNVGLTVDNLTELGAKIKNSETEFPIMVNNAQRYAKLIRSGFYTKQSILSALEKLTDAKVER